MLKQFIEDLEIGWDFAIEKLEVVCEDERIKETIKDYWSGYETTDYAKSYDPDLGTCFMIRQQAVRSIISRLEYIELLGGKAQ